MNAGTATHRHFTKFKKSHRQMALGNVDSRRFISKNGSSAKQDMQQYLHLPERLPWRLRFKTHLQKASNLVVTKKDDGAYSISKGMAGLFISAFLGVAVTATYGLLAQRDEIVRLRTLQEVQDKTNQDLMSKIDQVRNFTTTNDKNMARIEGKFDQFALTYSVKNADKAKVELSPE